MLAAIPLLDLVAQPPPILHRPAPRNRVGSGQRGRVKHRMMPRRRRKHRRARSSRTRWLIELPLGQHASADRLALFGRQPPPELTALMRRHRMPQFFPLFRGHAAQDFVRRRLLGPNLANAEQRDNRADKK
jgi:hypothetical protein